MTKENMVERLARGEDPWVIDPKHGCRNPATGYYPSVEVEACRRRLEANRRRIEELERDGTARRMRIARVVLDAQERAASSSLYPTTSRGVIGLPHGRT